MISPNTLASQSTDLLPLPPTNAGTDALKGGKKRNITHAKSVNEEAWEELVDREILEQCRSGLKLDQDRSHQENNIRISED